MGAYFPGRPRDEFSHPLVARYALKSGRVPHSGVFASGEASVCTPLAKNGVGLGPSSSSGPVASHPPLVDRSASAASRWFLSPGHFMRWSYPHGGSLAALPEVGLLGKGCWRIVRVLQILCLTPLPGMRSRLLFLASRYGRCSRQRHLHVAWNPPLSRARDCPSLPLRVATLSLKLSRSEVPGPHVLLSNYVARVISRGPGVLSSFCHPSWVVSLVLQNLIGAPWGSFGHTKGVFLVLKVLFILASASAEHIGVFHAMSFRGSLSRGWGEVSFSFVPGFVAKTQVPSSLAPRFAGFTVPAQPNARQSQWETVISCAGSQVLPGVLGLRIVGDANGSFLLQGVARRSYRRPLSPSGSGCRCHGCAGSRLWNDLFCVPWARCTRAVAPSLLWEELCCCPGGRARMWRSRSSLWGCYLGAGAPRFLAAFHRSCVVAVQDLVLSGPTRLNISLLTNWRLALGPCFLVRSPTIRRHPMGCHGWGFVYVPTFWNVVYIISWKYWITFLRNLSFLLR